MKRLVYLISTFLILTGMYGGNVGAGDLFWVLGYSGTSFKVPARKFLFNENHMSDSDKKSYVEWTKYSAIGVLDVALAQSSNGWAAGRDVSRELAKRSALKNCQKHIGSICRIVDVNRQSAFIKQRGSSGSSSTASSSNKIWCATPNSVTNVSRSQCKTGNGNIFTSKYQANAEHKRRTN